jgi:hypothetical protein
MFTFRSYTLDELRQADGKKFWGIFKKTIMFGIVRVIDGCIYLLHNTDVSGADGHNLMQDEREGFAHDWCIYFDTMADSTECNREVDFYDFAICKEKAPVKKKDIKLVAVEAEGNYIQINIVDAATGEHIRHALCISENGIVRHHFACPDAATYNIPKDMFDESGRIRMENTF